MKEEASPEQMLEMIMSLARKAPVDLDRHIMARQCHQQLLAMLKSNGDKDQATTGEERPAPTPPVAVDGLP